MLFGMLFSSVVDAVIVPGDGMILYSDNSAIPRYRLYNVTLSSQFSASNIGEKANWVRVARHLGRTEALMITLEDVSGISSEDVSFQTWNGSSWGSATNLYNDSDDAFLGIAVAYEQVNQRALILYGDNDQNTPLYRVWNGSLGSEQTGPDVGSIVHIYQAASNPRGNEILVLTGDLAGDVNFLSWNTTALNSLIELDDDSWKDYQPFGVEFENASGDALIVWSDNDQTTIFYRTWNGTLGSEVTGPSVGGSPRFFSITRNPLSDEVVVATVDDRSDTNVVVWNGTGFGSVTEVATSGTSNRKSVGVVYEQLNGRAIVVYNDGSSTPKYRIWNGAGWSSQASAQGVGGEPEWIELAAKPYSNEILMITQDDNQDVNVQVWNGSSWTFLGEVSTNTGVTSERTIAVTYVMYNDTVPSVILAEPQNSSISGSGNITFVANLSDDTSLVNATLYLKINGAFTANQTNSTSGISNQTSFKVDNFGDLTNITWNVLACDSRNQCFFAASNFTVSVLYSSTPPNISVNDNITFEDTAVPNNWIDLYDYANDAESNDNQLTFNIISQSNSSLINCSIGSNRYFNCNTPAANATGNSTIAINVQDPHGNETNDTLVITVNSINDAPWIKLDAPADGSNFTGSIVTLNGSAFDVENLLRVELYTNRSGSFVNEQNTSVNGSNKEVSFSLSFSSSTTFIWNMKVCDVDENCSFAQSNFTLTANVPVSSGSSSSSGGGASSGGGVGGGTGGGADAIGSGEQAVSRSPASVPSSRASAPSTASSSSDSGVAVAGPSSPSEGSSSPSITGAAVAKTEEKASFLLSRWIFILVLLLVTGAGLHYRRQIGITAKKVIKKMLEQPELNKQKRAFLASVSDIVPKEYENNIAMQSEGKQNEVQKTNKVISQREFNWMFPLTSQEMRQKGITINQQNKKTSESFDRYALTEGDMRAMFPQSLGKVNFRMPEIKRPDIQRPAQPEEELTVRTFSPSRKIERAGEDVKKDILLDLEEVYA